MVFVYLATSCPPPHLNWKERRGGCAASHINTAFIDPSPSARETVHHHFLCVCVRPAYLSYLTK